VRIVFMGASELGWECCRTLFEMGQDVVGIFSIPREFRISWSPHPVTNVRFKSFDELADQHAVPLTYVTKKMSDPEYFDTLRRLRPDILIVIGWYYLIPRAMRELAPLGAVGIHGSLLPRYRGGAPLVWAVINGEARAGISLFHLSDGVDDGDVIAQAGFDIAVEDTISEVIGKASEASVRSIRDYVPRLANGTAPRRPQDPHAATVVPQRRPEDGVIDWHARSAADVYNWVRAQTKPYPGAFTYFGRETVRIWKASCFTGSRQSGGPGTVFTDVPGRPGTFGVWCADGLAVLVQEVGLSDGTVLSGAEFVVAHKVHPGTLLGARIDAQGHASAGNEGSAVEARGAIKG
jgi:methionyl-tRNA formyltransferase